jgi:hypothetical protein
MAKRAWIGRRMKINKKTAGMTAEPKSIIARITMTKEMNQKFEAVGEIAWLTYAINSCRPDKVPIDGCYSFQSVR